MERNHPVMQGNWNFENEIPTSVVEHDDWQLNGENQDIIFAHDMQHVYEPHAVMIDGSSTAGVLPAGVSQPELPSMATYPMPGGYPPYLPTQFVAGDGTAGDDVPTRKDIEGKAQLKRKTAFKTLIDFIEPLRNEYSNVQGAQDKRGIADSIMFSINLIRYLIMQVAAKEASIQDPPIPNDYWQAQALQYQAEVQDLRVANDQAQALQYHWQGQALAYMEHAEHCKAEVEKYRVQVLRYEAYFQMPATQFPETAREEHPG